MAKILVADDNSNVQKTVALALADLGVEVVAVNNGDAAVRKLGDINPDLVLADIFMPVRNGYEVCDYVKKDSRFSHVPVVLLVGAFDPLDEREAKRVAADGILKKPFVPPDPLIAMVKTLLDRVAGNHLVAVGAAKPSATMESKTAGVAAAEKQPAPQTAPEPAPEMELQPPVERVSFGEGERPIAFGELLEPAAINSAPAAEPEVIEPITDDQVLTSSRDSALGEPVFWQEDEAETEEGSAEGEEIDSEDFLTAAWTPDLDTLPSHAEADAVQPVEPFELVRDESAIGAPTVVEPSPIVAQDAASQAALTVEGGRAPDLAANPLDWMSSAPPARTGETPEMEVPWTAGPVSESETVGVEHAEQEEQLNVVEEEPASDPSTWAIPPAPALSTIAPPAAPTWPIPPATISSLPSTTTTTAASAPAPPPSKPAASIAGPAKSQPSLKPLNQSADDTARSVLRQDWADLAASLQTKLPEPVAQKPKPAPTVPAQASSTIAPTASLVGDSSVTPEHSETSGEPDPALVEAVVQRVLDKMRPQVVDIITKEFLRPVVQALVSREIQKR